MWANVYLTYDDKELPDGTGSQIQRILGIFGIAKSLKVGYVHAGISDLPFFQSDKFSQSIEKVSEITKINRFFNLPIDSVTDEYDEVIKIRNLTRRKMARILLYSMFTRKEVLVQICLPHGVTDLYPWMYRKASVYLNSQNNMNPTKDSIVIHYRCGIDIVNDSTRFLHMEYFSKNINVLHNRFPKSRDFKIKVITDAVFKSYSDQQEFELQLRNFPNVEWIYAKDLLEDLRLMSTASIFLMSISSYSYVAGVLNQKGLVVYPPGHGHSKMPKWELGLGSSASNHSI